MQRHLVIALFVLLGSLAAWWLTRSDSVAQLPTIQSAAQPPTLDSPVSAPVVEAATSVVATDATVDAERVVVPPPEPAPAADRAVCTLRARCVDADDKPIAAIKARLLGWSGNSQREAEWRKAHEMPGRVELEATSDADGRFEFTFWPPPPFTFMVRLQGVGAATWSHEWDTLAPGSTNDLGDLRLAPGTLLRGRVVDADGAPVGKVSLSIHAVPRAAPSHGRETWCTAYTALDGTFTMRWSLAAGAYELGIDDHPIDHPKQVTLTTDSTEQSIDIVLARIDATNAISGIVVDQDGAPVRGAMIFPRMRGPGRVISSHQDGTFRVLRPEQNSPDKVQLTVQCDGYEATPDATGYAWGRTDVRLVLRKGAGLDVFVVRADGGEPVEDYLLRVMPIGGAFFSSRANEVRGGDHHPDGRCHVASIPPGKVQVFVESKADDLAIAMAPAEIAGGDGTVTVRLAATTPRRVHVQFADGTSVQGAKVQLVDALGEAFAGQAVCTLADWGFTTAAKALVLAEATTDADGNVTLRAPGDRQLGLCLPGPENPPLRRFPVLLPASDAFVVTVSRGATLRGHIGPEAALAEMRRVAGESSDSPNRFPSRTTIQLRREGIADSTPFGDLRTPWLVQRDGSYAIAGIPAGRWRLSVQHLQWAESGGHYLEEPAGVVDLADGEAKELDIDLSQVLPGELDGVVLHNGAPMAAAQLILQCQCKDDEGVNFVNAAVQTDDQGHFHATVRAGEHALRWSRQIADQWTMFSAPEHAIVQRGQTSQQTFTLQTGKVAVHVRDAAGKDLAGVRIDMRASGDRWIALPPTDDSGRTGSECDVATFTFSTLPKRLQDNKAQVAYYEAHPGERDPLARERIGLGTCTPRMGDTIAVELQLPADWDR